MLLALTLAAPATASATSLDYAALGDSHAAGTGAGDYIPDSGDCLRSRNSYASVVAADRRATLVFRACSGATTADIAAQASVLNAGTDLVTVQVGGNDAGFTNTLVACKFGDERAYLNFGALYLNDRTKVRADAAGFTFVDASPAFAGHGVCGADVWINGLRNPLTESYHPNRDGHLRGYFPALKPAL